MPITITSARPMVLMRSFIRRLFEVAPAEDESGDSENDGDVNKRVNSDSGDKRGRRRMTVRRRRYETVICEVRKQVVKRAKQPARAGAAERNRQRFQIRAEVADEENEKRE